MLGKLSISTRVIWSRVGYMKTQSSAVFGPKMLLSVSSFVFGLAHRSRKGRFGVSFESVGDETSDVFESHLLAIHQGVAQKSSRDP